MYGEKDISSSCAPMSKDKGRVISSTIYVNGLRRKDILLMDCCSLSVSIHTNAGEMSRLSLNAAVAAKELITQHGMVRPKSQERKPNRGSMKTNCIIRMLLRAFVLVSSSGHMRMLTVLRRVTR